jgi:7-carboxy-7-deazaguanine synthase
MKICEIFTSIQGESSYVGLPCTFIRLTGCNLDCVYCDTPHAKKGGVELSEDEIMNEVSLVGVNLVEITGGEPLLQNDVHHLIERLLNDGHRVIVETNGSLPVRDVDRRATILLDIKTPGSKMWEEMDITNLEYLKPSDEVKFVIVDKKDYKWAKDFIHKHHLDMKCRVLLSPAFGYLQPQELSKWMIEDRMPARLNLQVHKYIFGSDKKGV